MADHKRKTKEEVEAELEETKKTLETPEPPVEENQDLKEPQDIVDDTPDPEENDDFSDNEDSEQDSSDDIDPEPDPEKDPDYKTKFKESSREAQVIAAKNRKINEAIDKASTLPDPTDDELQTEFPEWEVMTDTEKRFAKDSLINKKFRTELTRAREEGKNIEEWNEKVDKFTDDPKTLVDNPQLEGKVEQFKVFASKPTRRGVEFGDLINAFLYDATKNAKPKQKGQMFPTGTGGSNEKRQIKDKITTDEGARLMKTNYNEYKRLLKAGKIELPV